MLEAEENIVLPLAIGMGVALAAMGSAYGLGKATAAAPEATGRQPEPAGNIRTSLIIGGALIEALTIYALLVSILLWTKLPAAEEALKATFGAK